MTHERARAFLFVLLLAVTGMVRKVLLSADLIRHENYKDNVPLSASSGI